MKTLKKINIDIETNLANVSAPLSKKESYFCSMLIAARNYIETNPTYNSIIRQKYAVESNLKIYEATYKMYKELNKNVFIDKKTFHLKRKIDTIELSKWRNQLRLLNYILEK